MDYDVAKLTVVSKPEDRIKLLVDLTNITVDDAIPIKRYWRSGRELMRMAKVYLDEENFEKCFILYMKYIILFIEELPKHCEYKTADLNEKNYVIKNCNKLVPLAEVIKSRIKKRYQKEYDEYIEKKKIIDAKLKENESKKLVEVKSAVKVDPFVLNLQDQLDRKRKELEQKNIVGYVQPEPKVELNQVVVESDEELEDFSNSLSDDMSALNIHNTVTPAIDRSTKPSNLVVDFDKDTLNQMIVPFQSITQKFTSLAHSNTSRNIETCAILAGRLSKNKFTITHLMLPKQTGTSDSCNAINEEEIMFEQERLQLITLGWIHTHPSQQSFLSSIDLHTHAPYQKMLPEAIAIVVAPKYNEICIYSLSEHGLDFILKCRKTGFHPHPNEIGLYGKSTHILIDDNLSIDVVDFR